MSAELIERVQDPIRENRPTYHPADPLIRFHYAVIRRHGARLSRHDADTMRIWRRIKAPFESQVFGPCVEAMARYWTMHIADPATLGGTSGHVRPTTVVGGRLRNGARRRHRRGRRRDGVRAHHPIDRRSEGRRTNLETTSAPSRGARERRSAVVRRKQSCSSSEPTSPRSSSRPWRSARTWSWSTSSVCTAGLIAGNS